ncbi:MAG: hypothetical protein K2Q14_04470 [Gammaproteobacteria bacterium]|nr:hypothetical protein [Gammaproteobacteria bacterium]
MLVKMLRPDSKGRITLGHLADGISGFAVTETDDHKIILEPYSEIPLREKWLFNNKVAMKKVSDGLKDAKVGKLIDRGSFSKFLSDDEK